MGLSDSFNQDKAKVKRETSVESYLNSQVKKIGGRCYKFVSPGYNGMPDRIILYKGATVFVETKRPGKKARKLQEIRLKEIQEQGIPAFVIDTKEKVDDFMASLVVRLKL